MWTLCWRMLHIRRMVFRLRSFKQHSSVFYYLNFSSICLCVFICNQGFFWIPPWSICSPLHALSDSVYTILLVLLSPFFSCPGLPSRDISLTTSSTHHFDRWMEIVWLRDPNSITALHYQKFCQLFSIDGFPIWYCIHFLLRVGSFGCSIFIPLRISPFLFIL